MKKLSPWVCAVMFCMLSTLTIAAELNDGQAVAQEATAVANQYQSIAQTIKTQGTTITALGEAHSALNISLVEKVKAIMQAIQLESQSLVNLVMDATTTNTTDTGQLNSIISGLDAQRQSLSTIIAPQLESTPTVTLGPENKKAIATAFQVYQ